MADVKLVAAMGGGSPVVKPTRDQILNVRTHGMQGMYCTVSQPGGPRPIPWTDGLITSPDLNAQDRQNVYAAHRALGDTHMLIVLTWAYREGGLPYTLQGQDLSNNLPAFRAYVEEIINAGFYPMIFLGGDGMSTSDGPPWSYNDPVGDTYGWQWLMANFARIHASLADLDPYVIWVPGFDGVVPGWQPPRCVDQWLLYARSVVGNAAYLGLELAAGYCVWAGDEGDNYPTPAGQALDLVLQEFPYPIGPPAQPPADFCNQPNEVRAPFDQVWQIAARTVPRYNRPAEQPACDDPSPPQLTNIGTPRGPFSVSAFEYDTYGWVRGISEEQVQIHRDYLRQIGYTTVG